MIAPLPDTLQQIYNFILNNKLIVSSIKEEANYESDYISGWLCKPDYTL